MISLANSIKVSNREERRYGRIDFGSLFMGGIIFCFLEIRLSFPFRFSFPVLLCYHFNKRQ